MSLINLHIKKSYSSDEDDILNDFYIPALQVSKEYYRLTGFFSSTSLAIAARGILGLIKNEGSIKLIVSPNFNKKDLDEIIRSCSKREEIIEHKMTRELKNLEEGFIKDHVSALGWMLANNRLEIRIAIAYDDEDNVLSSEAVQQAGIFHQKVGILIDSDGNTISFSGSVNETALGWLGNIEEFKVFRSWDDSELDYVKADNSKFNRFWDNQSIRIKIINLPTAVSDQLLKIAPIDINRVNLNKWYKSKQKTKRLFNYQNEAIESWKANGLKGIFEMATGTGKTFTALGCLHSTQRSNNKLLTVIACPYQHLVQQWKNEVTKFAIESDALIIADSTNPKWKNDLTDHLIDLSLGYINNLLVLTTHRTASSQNFIDIIRDNKKGSKYLLLADEVHGTGAAKSARGLLDEYDFRLGLSATPKRWFDEFGTDTLYSFFGGIVYEFTLADAINKINPLTGKTYLTPYRYLPFFISLTPEELEEYIDTSFAIAINFQRAKKDEEKNSILESLLFKRANIIKNAFGKYEVLEGILDNNKASLAHTIIYSSPQQIDKTMSIINRFGFSAHRFTMNEGTNPDARFDGLSEREFLLEKFAAGQYQVLVAMKCLDEGVDVPPAHKAILMASSGNPREYIQRIGRVIRRYPGKEEASIHDIIVKPSLEVLPAELRDIEKKVFESELARYEEIAKTSTNSAEAFSLIYELRNAFHREMT